MINLLMVLVGLAAGVVVNTLADDLPRRHQPGMPHCPKCNYRYRYYEWLAIGRRLSRGACPNCNLPTRRRAVAVEVALAILLLSLSWFETSGFELAVKSIYLALLMLTIITDIEHRLVLHIVTIPSIALALLASILLEDSSLLLGLVGAVLGFVLFFMAYLLGNRLFGPGALGFGDVTLATMIGAMLGIQVIFALVLGVMLAGIWSVLGLLSGRLTRRTTIAYGPFLSIAGMVMVIWGERFFDWYVNQ